MQPLTRIGASAFLVPESHFAGSAFPVGWSIPGRARQPGDKDGVGNEEADVVGPFRGLRRISTLHFRLYRHVPLQKGLSPE
ncbi:uncharacterized protein VTP21DRAFT_5959 [Calcarisporiella thermophila]|uniref:uncharacterized protein n=1 Tax=Calcarisporiella thermophila TaxID=911321 RepID=UPI0037449049